MKTVPRQTFVPKHVEISNGESTVEQQFFEQHTTVAVCSIGSIVCWIKLASLGNPNVTGFSDKLLFHIHYFYFILGGRFVLHPL